MTSDVLEWTFLVIAATAALGLVVRWMDAPDRPVEPCPHGYQDWDDCPDCCH